MGPCPYHSNRIHTARRRSQQEVKYSGVSYQTDSDSWHVRLAWPSSVPHDVGYYDGLYEEKMNGEN